MKNRRARCSPTLLNTIGTRVQRRRRTGSSFFFRYTSDRIKDESEFWFLWPLFDHQTAQGRTTETSFLFWLFEYRSPKANEGEYWALGHPPIAVFM